MWFLAALACNSLGFIWIVVMTVLMLLFILNQTEIKKKKIDRNARILELKIQISEFLWFIAVCLDSQISVTLPITKFK